MGHSRLFEVVFRQPGTRLLARGNGLPENTLVVAHVLGHADFSKNNALFRRSQEQVGYRFVDQAAQNARRIAAAIEEHGEERVEQVLDAALALEAHIDTFRGIDREPYASFVGERPPAATGDFRRRFQELPGEMAKAMAEPRRRGRYRRSRTRPAVSPSRPVPRTWTGRDIFHRHEETFLYRSSPPRS